ncbi:ATPase component of energizing module ofqueuosine-regulated ECF transporter [Salmonella enterica subsp. enterica]|uniref:ATPase component of energizing module ofqueuosine-regulated ECF transporter n=1 Tax=Salmonella enterica I TaxID=59201 RepID=A0A3S4IZA7_SALET|nr:ATPase component of energizing module ofqueuosine-regulated ECF transporter [Salmonella enterica subsp. enterica]
MQPRLFVLDEAFSRLTSAATGTLLERLQQWALERHSLIVLFERKHFPFLTPMPAGMAIARRSANPIMLTLNQVAYRWPDAAADCLHAISLEVQDGEWLALTGDNGAGKSTLLRIMAGLLSPTSGSVTLNGEPIAQLKNRQRAAAIGVLLSGSGKPDFPQQCRTRGRFWTETTTLIGGGNFTAQRRPRCGYAS